MGIEAVIDAKVTSNYARGAGEKIRGGLKTCVDDLPATETRVNFPAVSSGHGCQVLEQAEQEYDPIQDRSRACRQCAGRPSSPRALASRGGARRNPIKRQLLMCFNILWSCAFYVTPPAKKPFIRLKMPFCGLEALAHPPRFVFSRQGQLTHRPKSQARGL